MSYGMTGKKHSPQSREKMRFAHLGKNHSPATQFKKGATPWNRGIEYEAIKGDKNPNYGKVFTELEKENLRNKILGRKHSPESRKRMSESKRGSKAYQWKDGSSERQKLERKSLEYRLWRESVFIRDDYTCQECGERGGKLNAHHIKPYSKYPEFRVDIDNGITLCIDCHKKTDSWGYLATKLIGEIE